MSSRKWPKAIIREHMEMEIFLLDPGSRLVGSSGMTIFMVHKTEGKQ